MTNPSPTLNPMPDLLTAEDIATIRRTSVDAVYAARSRGELPPASRFGRRLFWRRSDIDAWIDGNRELPAGTEARSTRKQPTSDERPPTATEIRSARKQHASKPHPLD